MGAEMFNRYENKLASDSARIAFRRHIVNTFPIAQGTSNWHSYNLFSSDVPCRVFIGKCKQNKVMIQCAICWSIYKLEQTFVSSPYVKYFRISYLYLALQETEVFNGKWNRSFLTFQRRWNIPDEQSVPYVFDEVLNDFLRKSKSNDFVFILVCKNFHF